LTQTFRFIYIKNTNISEIRFESFTNIYFKNIVIEDNKKLIKIDPQSFPQIAINRLVVKNNPILGDINLYEFARKLNPFEIDFSGNILKEIPVKAFSEDPSETRLRTLTMDKQ